MFRTHLLVMVSVLFAACSSTPKARWRTVYREDFETPLPLLQKWEPATYSDADPYSDDGQYFREKDKHFKPPRAYRSMSRLGQDGWLEIQSYSRAPDASGDALARIVEDPADSRNHVLRIHSPRHTDATVLRPASPLPPEYRVCARVGYADFGATRAERHNGYAGDEQAEPWLNTPAVDENGFYWMAIVDSPPMPHNNVYIHHHRKVVIDSDNNDEPAERGGVWTSVWNGKEFIRSGRHIIDMFVLDKDHRDYVSNYDRTGQPFIMYSAGTWNNEVETKRILAVDAYLDKK